MIAVIADDLTGAAELAAVGWRYGLEVEVVLANADMDSPELTPAKTGSSSPELICVDTDSRMGSAAEAERRVASAVRALQRAGADWIYKKVDSILRGNVAVEVATVMRETGAPAALLVPANPSLGRVIRDGQYHVNGQLLNETEFARDPAHPRLSSNVVALLESDPRVQVHNCQPGVKLPATGITVGDAASQSDLAAWARQRRQGLTLGGGAEFFRALLAAQGYVETPNRAVEPPAFTNACALFVCGSTSQACRQFVERARATGISVFGLPGKLAHGETCDAQDLQEIVQKVVEALTEKRRTVLAIDLPSVGARDQARMLSVHLVAVATRVLRQTTVSRVFVEGGATAVELARSMGWQRLRVVQELALGVAMMEVDAPEPILFTMKPGSYLWPASVLPQTKD